MTRHRKAARQAAAVLAFAAAVAVTAATSPATQFTQSTGDVRTLAVDEAHGLAYQRFVVRIGPEAAAGLDQADISVVIDAVIAEPVAAGSGATTNAVAMRVEAVDPELEAGVSPVATRDPYARANAAGPWLVPGAGSATDIAVSCRAPGPCERAFRLVVAVADPSVTRAEVSWHLASRLVYSGLAYPSAAPATFVVDDPVAIAGPAPKLDAAAPSQRLVLSAAHPVAARIVEVHVPAGLLPASRPRPHASLLASLAPDTPPPGAASPGPPQGLATYAAQPVVSIAPIPASGTGSPPPVRQLPGVPSAPLDPVAGCAPGADCTSRVLVWAAWTGGNPAAYRLQLVLHWLDVSTVLRYGGEGARLTVTRTIEIEPRAAGIASAAGDIASGGGQTFSPYPSGYAGILHLATSVAASDPSLEPLLPLLPVPAAVRFRIDATATSDVDINVEIRAIAPPGSGVGAIQSYGRRTSATVDGNPLLGCSLGSECPLGVTPYATAMDGSPVRAHWSLEVRVYAYVGTDVTLESGP